ncbi:39948_t:CDS:2, partial [Gigaspora margarita]
MSTNTITTTLKTNEVEVMATDLTQLTQFINIASIILIVLFAGFQETLDILASEAKTLGKIERGTYGLKTPKTPKTPFSPGPSVVRKRELTSPTNTVNNARLYNEVDMAIYHSYNVPGQDNFFDCVYSLLCYRKRDEEIKKKLEFFQAIFNEMSEEKKRLEELLKER